MFFLLTMGLVHRTTCVIHVYLSKKQNKTDQNPESVNEAVDSTANHNIHMI